MKRYVILAGVNGAGKSTLFSISPSLSEIEKINLDEIVRDMTFTNWKGQTVTHDVLYEYNSTNDCWYAIRSYYERNWWTQGSEATLPADMVLTRAQVDAMQVDKNAGQLPTSGLIYDGTVAPGTPF